MWSKPFIKKERQLIKEFVEMSLRKNLSPLDALSIKTINDISDLDEENLLKRFVQIEAILQLQTTEQKLSKLDIQNILNLGLQILKKMQIEPYSCWLSHLYSDLYTSYSNALIAHGDHWQSSWQFYVGQYLNSQTTQIRSHENSIKIGNLSLRVGDAILALSHYLNAEQSDNPEIIWLSKLAKIKTFRLLDDKEQAICSINAAREELFFNSSYEKWNEPVSWELACQSMMYQKNFEPMHEHLAKSFSTIRSIEAKLWTLAMGSKKLCDTLSTVDYLKRMAAKKNQNNPMFNELCYVVQTLEECYDYSLSLPYRLSHIGELISKCDFLPSIEQELLVLSGSIKVLIKCSQLPLCDMAISKYIYLSSKLSGGKTKDILRSFPELDRLLHPRIIWNDGLSSPKINYKNEIPTSVLSRTFFIYKYMIKTSLHHFLNNFYFRLFSKASPTKVEIKCTSQLKETSIFLLRHMRRTKGLSMKFGQMLANSIAVPTPIRETLKALSDSAEPIDPFFVKEVFEKDFGMMPEEVFSEWNYNPIAVTSIGQVYSAFLKSGEPIIVKVRYPHIEKAFSRDFAFLNHWAHIFAKKHLSKISFSDIKEEIYDHINEELNYTNELKNHLAFIDYFKTDPDVIIPDIYPDLCSKNILTMQYIPGQRYSEFIQSVPQLEKNLAALTIMKMVLASIFIHKEFNGDPHPGNYLFLNNGKVVFLDFGCTKKLGNDYVNTWLNYFRSIFNQDLDMFRTYWPKRGFSKTNTNQDFNLLFEKNKNLWHPMITDKIMRLESSYLRLIMDNYASGCSTTDDIVIPKDSILFVRVLFGLISILDDLAPEANWRQLASKAFELVDQQKELKQNTAA